MRLFSASHSLYSRTCSFHQKIQNHFFRTNPTQTRLSKSLLYRTISPLGDPNASVVPVLDELIEKGNPPQKWEIQQAIGQLMTYKRFRHALEVSLWMTNKMSLLVSPFDIGVRLKLIRKIFGLEQAENYFYKIPENMRTYEIYLALLNCYTTSRSVDKAESIMQKARDLGYATKPVWYNLMMNMYYQLGNREKLFDLLIEIEENGISYDQFTYSVCLNACAMASDAEGMNKVLRIMESDPVVCNHWKPWVTAAKCYLTIGLNDEALLVMHKLEKWIKATSKGNNFLYAFLIKLYAEAGKRDELYRFWEFCRKRGKVLNKVYMSMMRSLMKFDDIKGMEKIFEEWESSPLLLDFRVPNFLIDAYCRDGLLEKAEALITRVQKKGGNPIVTTWCHLTGGYLKKNRVPEAVGSLRKAISVCPPRFMTQKDCLIKCLEHLEKGDCMKKGEELISFIRTQGIWREAALNELRSLIERVETQDSEMSLAIDKVYVDDLEENSVLE